jgi:PKD repeat protein
MTFVNRKLPFLFYCFIILLPIGCFLFPESLSANSNFPVVINEIAWMGIPNNAYAEWIELYSSNPNEEIIITGFTISTDNGLSITIGDENPSIIPPNGYFLILKNTSGDLPGTQANQIYSGKSLRDSEGEKLTFKNSNGELLEEINCSNGWFAGNSKTKQTMERKNPGEPGNNAGNWQASLNPSGTPGAPNSSGALENTDLSEEAGQQTGPPQEEPSENQDEQIPKAEAGPDITALINQEISFNGAESGNTNQTLSYLWNFGDGSTSDKITTTHLYKYPGAYIVSLSASNNENSATDTAKITIYANSIIISEFIPNPEGTDKENEWIELYNNSDQAADLSGWQIANSSSGTKPFVFPSGTLILARQFLVLAGPTSKITINNTTGSLKLFYPNGQTEQEIKYEKAKAGQSIALSGNNQYFWTATPTPGMANIISNADLTKTSFQPPGASYQAQETQGTQQNIISANSLNSNAPQGTIINYSSPASNMETAPSSGQNITPATLANNIETEPAAKEITQQENGNQTASLASKLSSPPLLIASIIFFGLAAGFSLVSLRKKLRRRADKITIDWQD